MDSIKMGFLTRCVKDYLESTRRRRIKTVILDFNLADIRTAIDEATNKQERDSGSFSRLANAISGAIYDFDKTFNYKVDWSITAELTADTLVSILLDLLWRLKEQNPNIIDRIFIGRDGNQLFFAVDICLTGLGPSERPLKS